MVRIELNYEESLKYFDECPITTEMFEQNCNMITEIEIEDGHVMYRFGTETDIGTATWEDDDYDGATDKLKFLEKLQ